MKWLRRAVLLYGTTLLFACGGVSAPEPRQERIEPRQNTRASVERALQDLSRNLRGPQISRTEEQFSRGYIGGYEELRDKMRASQRAERVTDIQFIINRILESGDKLEAQVNWNKAFLGPDGRPGIRRGTSEIEFQRFGDRLRILNIRGAPLF